MSSFLLSLGADVAECITDGYVPPAKGAPLTPVDKKNMERDGKAMNAIFSALSEKEMTKVMGMKTAKEVWDKLANINEGDTKVKEAKLQIWRGQFEDIKMNDDKFGRLLYQVKCHCLKY